MLSRPDLSCTAFDGQQRLASGPLLEVVRATKLALDSGINGSLLILDNQDSRQVEVDFRGTLDEVLARLSRDIPAATPASRGRGRPKLGVVPREVTLLPRHWEWLATQPGGASAALRRLVEQALRNGGAKERARLAIEAVDRFMQIMTGNLPGHEEASRAFYRGERPRFTSLTAAWPQDVRTHLERLATRAWDEQGSAS